MPSYISQTGLRSMMIDALWSHAPSVLDVRLEIVRCPFRPRNWRIVWLGEAKNWIAVPDRHSLDGQVYGREAYFERNWDCPEALGYGQEPATT